MTTNLVSATSTVWAGLEGAGIEVTQTGLVIRKSLDFDDFGKAFRLLLFLDDRYKVFLNFALGDLYNALDLQHGSKRSQILDSWGEAWYHRLNDLGKIAARIAVSCRQDMSLPWHVYEVAGQRYVPEEVRQSLLQSAKDFKEEGKYVSREMVREVVKCHKPQKAKAQPQWSNGKFGAESTEPSPFEGQPEKGGDRNEEHAMPELREAARSDGAVQPGHSGGGSATVGTVEEPVKEGAGGGYEWAEHDWVDGRCGNCGIRENDTTIDTDCAGAGYQGDGGPAPLGESIDPSYHSLLANTMNYRKQIKGLQAECESLRTEIGTLKAKLAGIWDLAVELDDDHMKALDKIVKHRRSKFPKDEIDRQTEVQAAIRRRGDEIKRSHKAIVRE